MPSANIYHAEKKIASEEFQRDFMILKNTVGGTEIRWEVDRDTGSERGGIILVWIRSGMRPPEIHFVPPGWKLTIDGVTVVEESAIISRKREYIPINGTVVELQHGRWSFVFQFSK